MSSGSAAVAPRNMRFANSGPISTVPAFSAVRVTDTGAAVSAGELITLAARQSVWMPMGRVSDGLPVELVDARPSGFLGRHFAAIHADLRLPPRLADWSDHHILLAMSRRGEDLPGNLIAGDESFVRWQKLEIVPRNRDDYPTLAEATTAGHPPGSSAGGERPKFGYRLTGGPCLSSLLRKELRATWSRGGGVI